MSHASEIFILGSGRSIEDLTAEEKAYINSAACRLALNKFTAFHDVCGIMPTHVFFLDNHEPASRRFLQYVFDVCRAQGLRGMTFVVNKELQGHIAASAAGYGWKRLTHSRLGRRLIRTRTRSATVFRGPAHCRFEYAINRDFLGGDPWASSLKEPLFHHRGSLTSALNYAAIRFPGAKVKLVGVDLNRSGYFYQSHLESLQFEWQDFSTPIGREAGVHFSMVPHYGTTLFDRFDYVVDCLRRTNNELVCCSAEGELVKRGLVEYEPVLGDRWNAAGARGAGLKAAALPAG